MCQTGFRAKALASLQGECVTFPALGSSERALLHSRAAHSFTQVCWRQHNAALSRSKCFWIGICSLSHKMESRGGLGIWKGHIWGPPRWVFTFKDKWSHWVSARCEWAPSAHTGFLNAHQNNLSKPKDAFLRCLMWGQTGNHFNKIPLRLNCISQRASAEWGETWGTVTAEPLPAGFTVSLKRGDLSRWQVDSGCTSSRNACVQTLHWGDAKAGSGLDAKMR